MENGILSIYNSLAHRKKLITNNENLVEFSLSAKLKILIISIYIVRYRQLKDIDLLEYLVHVF